MVAQGVSISRVAACVGCSPATIYRWIQSDLDFQQRLSEVRYFAVRKPVELIRRHAESNWRAAVYLLERESKKSRNRKPSPNSKGDQLVLKSDHPLRDFMLEVAQLLGSATEPDRRDQQRKKFRKLVEKLESRIQGENPKLKLELCKSLSAKERHFFS